VVTDSARAEESWPAISRLVAPVAAKRTTWSSWGVSRRNGSALVRRTVISPAARSSLRVQLAHRGGPRRAMP
jgi:hypothetical protein